MTWWSSPRETAGTPSSRTSGRAGKTKLACDTQRTKNQTSCLIDIPLGVVALGVGIGEHPIALRWLRDLLGRQGFPNPGVRVLGRHLAHARIELTEDSSVFFQAFSQSMPQGAFEKRVLVDGHAEAIFQLQRVEDFARGFTKAIRGLIGRLFGLLGCLAGNHRPQRAKLGFPADDKRHLFGTVLNLPGGIRQKRCLQNPDLDQFGPCPRRAQAFGKNARRIRVVPDTVGDADRRSA